MATTDHAMKRLFSSTSPAELVRWLAGLDVQTIVPVSIEHLVTPDPIRSDLVFLVTLTDGRTVLMPIEFQGRRTHRPVPLRLLDYQTRIVINDKPDILLCAVCYVEEGAGRNDTGQHMVASIGAQPALTWNYLVVRFWEMDADDVLALNRPALLPLVSLMFMADPERVIRQTIEKLEQIPDQEERETLTIEFLALARNEEMKAIIQHMLRRKNMVFHSPFLEEVREEGYKEGLLEGIGKGREEGHEQGLLEARTLHGREYILDTLIERFDPPATVYRTIERALTKINDYATLRSLFTLALRAATIDEFSEAVAQQKAG